MVYASCFKCFTKNVGCGRNNRLGRLVLSGQFNSSSLIANSNLNIKSNKKIGWEDLFKIFSFKAAPSAAVDHHHSINCFYRVITDQNSRHYQPPPPSEWIKYKLPSSDKLLSKPNKIWAAAVRPTLSRLPARYNGILIIKKLTGSIFWYFKIALERWCYT